MHMDKGIMPAPTIVADAGMQSALQALLVDIHTPWLEAAADALLRNLMLFMAAHLLPAP